MLQTIAGPDPRDPTSARREVPDYLARIEDGIEGLRIAVCEDFFGDGIDPDVAALNAESIEVLKRLGAEIRSFRYPDLDKMVALANIISGSESAAFHAPGLARDWQAMAARRAVGWLPACSTRR